MNAVLAEPALHAYRDAFASVGEGDAPWLKTLRGDAFARFIGLGLPGRKEEAWRHLDLGPIRDHVFPPAGAPDLPGESALRELVVHWPEHDRLVFVDGVYAPALSSPPRSDSPWRFAALAGEGFTAGERPPVFAELADAGASPFAAWNTAFVRDGAALALEAGSAVSEPATVIFVTATGGVHHPRLTVHLGREARGVLVEEYVSLASGAAFANAVGEIRLADGAGLDHIRLQREGAQFGLQGTAAGERGAPAPRGSSGDAAAPGIHYGTLAVEAGRDARYTSTSVALGGGPARIDLHVRLAGEGAECRLHGLYLPDGRRVVDHHTVIDHLVPHTASGQLYKGILAGHARSVFNGMIHIHPDAQKTKAEQHNPNLLLSPDALANSNPQLRIHADDVTCRHGSTIGKLEEDKLFYLRSRGLSAREAALLLVTAFAAEIVEGIAVTPVREALAADVARRCSAHV